MHTFAQKPTATQQTTFPKSIIPGQVFFENNPEVRSILHLQRKNQNQAVKQMLQTGAEESEAELTSPSLPGVDFNRIPIFAPGVGTIQKKLTINKSGDSYELEADSLAERVMRMSGPQLHRACHCGGGCPKCRSERPGPEHKSAQTSRVHGSNMGQITAPSIVHEVLRAPGQPLNPATRAYMEPRFGYDFSRVRVHLDAAAARSARDLNANAYTVGRNIVFGAGRFAPETNEGRHLIAHELTHVVQQSAADRMLLGQGNSERRTINNPAMLNVVQRDEGAEYGKTEGEVVDEVIDALKQPTYAGVNVDPAFEILNAPPLPFLVRVMAELYDQGYFSGLLGYLATGTKANHKLIVAIRLTQCQKDTSYLFKLDILEAERYLKDDVTLPPELTPMLECLQRERIRLEKQEGDERFKTKFESGSENCVLKKGIMEWNLYPFTIVDRKVKKQRMQIRFYPRAPYQNKTVSFIQTLIEKGAGDEENKIDIGKNADVLHPFYGVQWETGKGQWAASNEGKDVGFRSQPNSAGDPYAYLFDEPVFFPPPHARIFETVAVVLETGETLGSLTWGVGTYTEKPKCTEQPSAKFNAAVETFYTPKDPAPAHGSENFDLVFERFAPDDASLTAGQKKQLDPIVTRTQKMIEDRKDKPETIKQSLVIEGFGDTKDTDPMAASEKRARAIKAYFISKGIPSNTIGMLFFGAAWARYEVTSKKAQGGGNRRVQIRLY